MAVNLRTQGTQRQEKKLLTRVPEETAMDVCLDPSRNQSHSGDRGAPMHQVTLCDSVSICAKVAHSSASAVKIKTQLVKFLQKTLSAFSLVFLTLS